MARIDWTVLCDTAFLDQRGRLCLIGINQRLAVPALPFKLQQVMLVARLVDIRAVDEISVSVGIVAPSGFRSARTGSGSVVIEMAGEYILVTLREIPLLETGVHRFQIRLRGQPVAVLDVNVSTAPAAAFTRTQ